MNRKKVVNRPSHHLFPIASQPQPRLPSRAFRSAQVPGGPEGPGGSFEVWI